MEKQTTFRIGISMAGAISAGAYTAGVMDYLLEALENWQKAKELNLPGTPGHHIIIEILSGASAGGMTAVLTAAAVQMNFPHIDQHNYSTETCKENPLYDSWVNLTESHKNDIMSQMLDSGDIEDSPVINPGKEVRSIFNSQFIEKIACRTLHTIVKDPNIYRPYFAGDLELVTTLTNLRGYHYHLEFIADAGKREDRMTMHKDLLHFQLNPSEVYQDDGKIPFHFETADGLNKHLLADAAIATGAFPAGLAPRVVTRDPKYINENPLLKISNVKEYVVDPLSEYIAVCVDGGVINNEPYDLTETILTSRREKRSGILRENRTSDPPQHSKSASKFDTTVLMIDPFPNYDHHPGSNYFDLQSLKANTFQLFNAMRRQLMVKSDLLAKAFDEDDFSRFMIAPVRSRSAVTQKYGIACGSAAGFGGFFSKKFRTHDYMLGRRNCQRFIQEFFCVPVAAGNPIIHYGYEGLNEEERAFLSSGKLRALPIIPDIRLNQKHTSIERPVTEEEFPYPSVGLKYLAGLERKVRARFGIVLDNLPNNHHPAGDKKTENPVVRQLRKKSWFTRYIVIPVECFAAERYISIGKRAVKHLAAKRLIDAVITDLDERGLLKK